MRFRLMPQFSPNSNPGGPLNQQDPHSAEIRRGDRFAFGDNWSQFLSVLDENRIRLAEHSLQRMLERPDLRGLTFLDVGSGSGLFSLAAHRLGARVSSFDFDPQSVACTTELKRRFFPGDPQWTVQPGSALDQAFLDRLGSFDIVYAWGVLHHTGSMWQAMEGLAPLVQEGGQFFMAIYNDQGRWSERWRWFKRTYNRLPKWVRRPYAFLVMGPRELRSFAFYTLTGRPNIYINHITNYAAQSLRGMSYWHDLIDWIGGYPFEVARPEQVFEFMRQRGFQLDRLKTCGGGLGCNEFVFSRPLIPTPASRPDSSV